MALPILGELPWLKVRPVGDRTLLPLVTHLGDGEKEVLALGLERAGALLLLDDRETRRHAKSQNLDVTGTLGILLLAKDRGIISAIHPILDRLHALRFRLDDKTRQAVLKVAGEGA